MTTPVDSRDTLSPQFRFRLPCPARLRQRFEALFVVSLALMIVGCQDNSSTAPTAQDVPAVVKKVESTSDSGPHSKASIAGQQGENMQAQDNNAVRKSGEDSRPSKRVSVALVYSPKYTIKLGGLEKLHPFDIAKYDKIYSALIEDKVINETAVVVPSAVTHDELRLVHTEGYLERLKERKNIAAYLEAEALLMVPMSLDKHVLGPFRMATGGTILAAREAIKCGLGINLGGGYHHAKPDTGEGFCVYADVPIAIRKLQSENQIKRALVIDVDVHQGNGTAVCLANDDATFTFSMHQGDIYPIPKEESDLDVELEAGMGDEEFIETLENHLDQVFEEARADICFIVGGCDPLKGDPLASLEMTHQGIKKRDALIVDHCVKRNIPVVLTLSGGYSPDAWKAQYLSVSNLIKHYGMKPESIEH